MRCWGIMDGKETQKKRNIWELALKSTSVCQFWKTKCCVCPLGYKKTHNPHCVLWSKCCKYPLKGSVGKNPLSFDFKPCSVWHSSVSLTMNGPKVVFRCRSKGHIQTALSYVDCYIFLIVVGDPCLWADVSAGECVDAWEGGCMTHILDQPSPLSGNGSKLDLGQHGWAWGTKGEKVAQKKRYIHQSYKQCTTDRVGSPHCRNHPHLCDPPWPLGGCEPVKYAWTETNLHAVCTEIQNNRWIGFLGECTDSEIPALCATQGDPISRRFWVQNPFLCCKWLEAFPPPHTSLLPQMTSRPEGPKNFWGGLKKASKNGLKIPLKKPTCVDDPFGVSRKYKKGFIFAGALLV